MGSNISVFFDVPKQVYKILQLIAEPRADVSLYCLGQNKILLATSLEQAEVEVDFDVDLEEEGNWEDIEDFDDSWENESLPF